MTLPTLSRTWQFNVNEQIADLGGGSPNHATDRRVLRTFKNRLVGTAGTWTDSAGSAITPTGGWTVVASSNGSAAGHDGVDRWAADSDINWALAANAHSWIVLRQTGISSTFEMLISCGLAGASANTLTVSVSHTGYGVAGGGANGTTTADPTALNSNTLISNGNWGAYAVSGFSQASRIHVLRSADGAATRLLWTSSGVIQMMALIEKAQVSLAGWTQPYLAFLVGGGPYTSAPAANAVTASTLSGSGVTAIKSFDASAFGGTLTCESPRNSFGADFQAVANTRNSALPLLGIGYWSLAASNIGRYGSLVDMWFGLTSQLNGSGYPASAPLDQFAQVGALVWPWNRSIPNFTGV